MSQRSWSIWPGVRGPIDHGPRETALITWDRRDPTGGNVYNEAVADALRALGRPVVTIGLPGRWPDGDPEAHGRLAAALADHPVALVDGVVASNAPGPLAAAVAAGHRVVVLLHMPLGTPAERAALAAASAVVCTSRHAALQLDSLDGRPRAIFVAQPGVEPAPAAIGSHPLRIVSVANLLPHKDQLTLVDALARIAALPWTARLVGSTQADPDYAGRVRRAIDEFGLGPRVAMTGALRGPALAAEWAAADLLVLVSRQESYGMVVAEALAHGVPALVAAGTGATEALVGPSGGSGAVKAPSPAVGVDAGAVVSPGDPEALARVLSAWVTEAGLRERWRLAALRRREELPSWLDTARTVARALDADQLPG